MLDPKLIITFSVGALLVMNGLFAGRSMFPSRKLSESEPDEVAGAEGPEVRGDDGPGDAPTFL